jgi:hypothetical protein
MKVKLHSTTISHSLLYYINVSDIPTVRYAIIIFKGKEWGGQTNTKLCSEHKTKIPCPFSDPHSLTQQ